MHKYDVETVCVHLIQQRQFCGMNGITYELSVAVKQKDQNFIFTGLSKYGMRSSFGRKCKPITFKLIVIR